MDIIWGNVSEILSPELLKLEVTHQKDSNKEDYAQTEQIYMKSVDIFSIPENPSERSIDVVKENLDGRFVKCEIENKDPNGNLVAIVSHSGQGGY